jgi:hypothetical protein
MPGSSVKLWLCALGLLCTTRLASSRTFVFTGDISRPHSISQVENPHWSPKKVPVAEVLAAPFRKHKIPMPQELQIAVDDAEGTSVPNRRFQSKKRANGQSVDGSSGQ